jgi:hypothetical protein
VDWLLLSGKEWRNDNKFIFLYIVMAWACGGMAWLVVRQMLLEGKPGRERKRKTYIEMNGRFCIGIFV